MKIAKQSVKDAVKERKNSEVSSDHLAAIEQDRGAFVTLKERGELRGCIGYISPVKPLYLTVRDVAAAAALEDSRFRPVELRELPQLEFEVSVLSPLRRVTDIKQIKVGEHGLVMRKGDREGLLLPQVPVEQHWDRATFLEQTCVKAGLPPGRLEGRGDRHLHVYGPGLRRTTPGRSRLTSTGLPCRNGDRSEDCRAKIYHSHEDGAAQKAVHGKQKRAERHRAHAGARQVQAVERPRTAR